MSTNNTFAIAYKYQMLGRCVIPSGGRLDSKSALMTLRYLKTLSADESLKIQQGINFDW